MTGTTGTVAWVTIVPDDLYAHLNAPQADALRNAALSANQTGSDGADSVFYPVMQDNARRIRQYIASNPRNRLSATDYSVPPELKRMLEWFTLRDMLARLSIAIPLNPDQKDAIRNLEDDLDKIRNIQPPWLLVSRPVDPEASPEIQLGSNATVVRHSHRELSRHSMKAL
jgi:hypothetical protein